MSQITRRQMLSGSIAIAAVGAARPAMADAPAPFAIDEVVDSGHRFFGALSRGLAEVVQEAGRRWVCQTATFSARRLRRPLSAAFVTAKGRCIPKRGRCADLLARTFARL